MEATRSAAVAAREDLLRAAELRVRLCCERSTLDTLLVVLRPPTLDIPRDRPIIDVFVC